MRILTMPASCVRAAASAVTLAAVCFTMLSIPSAVEAMARDWLSIPTSERSIMVKQMMQPRLEEALAEEGLRLGAPIFIRIYKMPRQLELWVEGEDGRYDLFRTFSICAYSGGLGPKHYEGDLQSPEGFYSVRAENLNPNSRFHLSFDIGFPNAYDRAHGRTGAHLMVHGDCISEGCYAMTDGRIEEIYTLAAAALDEGQTEIPVHIFPFRMSTAAVNASRRMEYHDFWRNLLEGHALFEKTRVPPMVYVSRDQYIFAPRKPGWRDVETPSRRDAPDRLPLAAPAVMAQMNQGTPEAAEPETDENGETDGEDGVPCGWPKCSLPSVQ